MNKFLPLTIYFSLIMDGTLNNLFAQPNFTNEALLSGNSANASFVNDLDQDGDMDILFSSYEANKLYWLERNEGEYIEHDLHEESQIGGGLEKISSIYSVDFDSDGDVDIIASGFENDKVGVYLNNGSQVFEFVEVGNPDGPLFITAVDLDNNGFLDIMCASLYDNTVRWYKTEPVDDSGQMSYSPEIISNNAVGPASLAIEDIDNDGDLDVVSAGCYDTNNKVAVFLNDGNENFSEIVINSDNGAGYAYVSVDDIFPGGNLEIVAASSDNKMVQIWYDDGTMTFPYGIGWSLGNPAPYNFNYSQIIDIDADNDLDILFAGYNSSDSKTTFGLLKNDGEGYFTDEIINSSDASASIRGSMIVDLDQDEDLDIIFALIGKIMRVYIG